MALGAIALATAGSGPAPATAQQAPQIVHGSPSWAPDGTRLAFHSNRDTGAAGAPGLDVFVARSDGSGGIVNLTRGGGLRGDAFPAWSPNGELIAFVRSEPAGWAVWVTRPDGTGQRHVAAGAAPGRVSWSPDSTRIAYGATNRRLRIASAAGNPPVELPTRGGAHPAWSPDGARIAYLGGDAAAAEVYVAAADGSGERNVSNDGFRNDTLDWSPDGSRVVYDAVEADGARGVYTVAPDGTDRTRISDGRDPEWEPGTRIVLARDRPPPPLVLSVTGTGGDARVVRTGAASQFAWSRDATRIAFVEHGEGREDLVVVNADGGGARSVAAADTAGRRVDVAAVQAPDRLVVSIVRFRPSAIRSRTAPVQVSVRVLDTRGRAVRGALVFLRSTPLVTTTPPERATGPDGWATFTIRPQPGLRAFFRSGYSVQFFVRARKPGDPLLAGVSSRRLVQVRVQP